eukprot:200455-Amphidinium_carterae.2
MSQHVSVHRILEGFHVELSKLLVEDLEGPRTSLGPFVLQHVLSGSAKQGRRIGLRLEKFRLPHILGSSDGVGGRKKLQRGRRGGPPPLESTLPEGELKELAIRHSKCPDLPKGFQQLLICRIMSLRPRRLKLGRDGALGMRHRRRNGDPSND